MPKRKSIPQRAIDFGTTLTWSLGNNNSLTVTPPVNNSNINDSISSVGESSDLSVSELNGNSPVKRRKSKCLIDDVLESCLADCIFRICVKKSVDLTPEEKLIFLGNVSIIIKSEYLPECDQFWLYISEIPNRSFLYMECVGAPIYFPISTFLDLSFYSGLTCQSFVVKLECFNKETCTVIVSVHLRKSHCLPCTAHLHAVHVKSKFQNVLSYFTQIEPPAYEQEALGNQDVELLYQAVMNRPRDEGTPYVHHASLIPQLRPYQQDAVRWMLAREKTPCSKSSSLHCLYCEVVTADGTTLYYNKYAGYVTLEKPAASLLPSGGILADEMGLGKTVEVLACILSNPRDLANDKHTSSHVTGLQQGGNESNSDSPRNSTELVERNFDPSDNKVISCTENNLLTVECAEHDSEQETRSAILNNVMQDKESTTVNIKTEILNEGNDVGGLPLITCIKIEGPQSEKVVSKDPTSNLMESNALQVEQINHEEEVDQKANSIPLECHKQRQSESNSEASTVMNGSGFSGSKLAVSMCNEEPKDAVLQVKHVLPNQIEECQLKPNLAGLETAKCSKSVPITSVEDNASCINIPGKMNLRKVSTRKLKVQEEDFIDATANAGVKLRPRRKGITKGREKKNGSLPLKGVSKMDSFGETIDEVVKKYCSAEETDTLTQTINEVVKKYCIAEETVDTMTQTIDEVVKKYCIAEETDTMTQTINEVVGNHGCRVKTPKSAKQISLYRMGCQVWYNETLQGMSPLKAKKRHEVVRTMQCVCGLERLNHDKVQCVKCGAWQHSNCVNYRADHGTYYCPQCWDTQEEVLTRGTLIVSPSTICSQWVMEIKKHINDKNFSVFVYRGMHETGFVQPQELARYQVVITTYEILRKEFNYVDSSGTESRNLRHAKRFPAPPSSLLCMQWWRLCLDEAQMVECITSKTAEMARRINAVHRWAVTGTPISKSIHDVFGLVQFLDVKPYSQMQWWEHLLHKPYCHGNQVPLVQLLSQIMWRNNKKDVLEQINLPNQSEEVEWLHFTPIEAYFYRCQHEMCSKFFQYQLARMPDLDVTLCSLDKQAMNKILSPMLSLRQACSHPTVVQSHALGSFRSTVTMDQLLESLVKKAANEGEESLRQYIASLNGLAGLHIIREEWVEAVATYRTVLYAVEKYKDSLKVDTLQQIHTLDNLADIIDGHKDTVPRTLRDDGLREESSDLQHKYMTKFETQMAAVQEVVAGLAVAVLEHESKMNLEKMEWWLHILELVLGCGQETALVDKIWDDLQLYEHYLTGKKNFQMTSVRRLQYELGIWSDLLHKGRDAAVEGVRRLQVESQQDLVNEAVVCHLRASNLNMDTKKICNLCKCEKLLKVYETQVFAVSKKDTNHSLVGEVLMLGQLNQGTWHPNEMERVLRAIVSFCRGKQMAENCIENGNLYLKILDLFKKEFKHLRNLWMHVRDHVSRLDELNMAKMRLRLQFPDEPSAPVRKKHDALNQLSSNLTNVLETIHIIEPYELASYTTKLQLEKASSNNELVRKTGQLAYLTNLQKRKGMEINPDPCPICHTGLGDKWCVVECGHCYCFDCMMTMMRRSSLVRMKCPMCRLPMTKSDVSCVTISAKPGVIGSSSTKLEAIVHRLLTLRSRDPNVKALVFSTWEKVLDVLELVLLENRVSYSRLVPGKRYRENLLRFQRDPSRTALLLTLRAGAKGLNLIEASHILFVEPILNRADEQQAIGRIHRIGQTKETVIHRFLIRNTIEESLHTSVQSCGENWEGNKVTLNQLQNLFTVASQMPLSLHATLQIPLSLHSQELDDSSSSGE